MIAHEEKRDQKCSTLLTGPPADALVESLPIWPLMETTVLPLTTFEGRIQAVQSKLKQLKSLVQDPAGVIAGVT
jgi:hypothetical protein